MAIHTLKKSDNLISMKKTLTATEVARNFSAVLDSVEDGDEVAITRGKKVVATLTPTIQKSNGASVISFLEKWHDKNGPMDEETFSIYEEVLADRRAPHNLADSKRVD